VDVKGLTDERLTFADGEVVWSWRPKVWRQVLAKPKGFAKATVANGMVHRGHV
jgi:hypothetical protein